MAEFHLAALRDDTWLLGNNHWNSRRKQMFYYFFFYVLLHFFIALTCLGYDAHQHLHLLLCL